MTTIARDVAVGWRRLKATPTFTFFSVFTLALGIAAVTGACAVVRAVAAPPSGVPDVHGLLTISHTRFGERSAVGFSTDDFGDLARRQTTMQDMAAFVPAQQVLTVDGHSRTSFGEVVTGTYFRMLQVNVALGRAIQPSDDVPGAPPVTVISHELWQSLFAGRPDVIGRIVTIGGHTFEVVGVAPPGFVGLFSNGRYPAMTWVPMATAHLFEALDAVRWRADRDARWLYVRARPMPGVSIDQVAAEVTAIANRLDQEQPLGQRITDPRLRHSYHISRNWVVRHSQDLLMDESSSALLPPLVYLLLSAVALVLLVVCTNLANLVVARGAVRRHEMAVRVALGATRTQLIAGCLTEVLIVAAAGGALGLVFTWLALQWFGVPFDIGRGITFMLAPRVDLVAFLVAFGAALLSVVIAGVIPGWILTRQSTHAVLVSGGALTVVSRWRVRRMLIAAQVAVSVVLLLTAALFLGQVIAHGRFSGGLELDRLAIAEVDLGLQGYDDSGTDQLVSRVLARLESNPEIEFVAASSGLPFGPVAPTGRVHGGDRPVFTQTIAVTRDFFNTTGAAILSGRPDDPFRATDGRPMAVVDEALALRLFGHTNVVGQQLEVTLPVRRGGEPTPELRTISAVVEAAGHGSYSRSDAMYTPLEGRPLTPIVFSARTSADPARIADEMRAALREADPDIGISQAGPARTMSDAMLDIRSILASVASLLGGTGLVVVLTGLYGVLSYLVSKRTREIGMRLALGATPRRVLMMVIREGLAPVVVGTLVGGAMAWLIGRWFQAVVYSALPGANLLLFAVAPAIILLASTLACYFPARRASRIQPASALKE